MTNKKKMDLLEKWATEYAEELEQVENFYDYFDGYEDEETGKWIEAKTDIYGVDWYLSGWNCNRAGLTFEGVKVLTGIGGPGSWIDTKRSRVGYCWGFDSITKPISYETAERIDEYFEDRLSIM